MDENETNYQQSTKNSFAISI